MVESWGRGRRVGIVPLPDGRVYWFFTESAPGGAQQDTTVTDLANRVAGWHPPIPQLTLAIYAGHATSDPDLDAGLDRYDRERRPRTQRLIGSPHSSAGSGKHATH